MKDSNTVNRIRLLIVDDNRELCDILQHYFEMTEDIVPCGAAYDGEEALQKIAHLQPDVVFLDIIMPRIDGLSVLEQLRKNPPQHIPKIIVASAIGQEALSKAVSVPFVSVYLPIDAEHFQMETAPSVPDLYLYQNPEDFVAFEAVKKNEEQFAAVSDYKNPQMRTQLKDLGISSILSIPVFYGNEAIAGVSFFFFADEPPCFTEDQREFIQKLFHYAASQLNSIQQFQQLQMDVEHYIHKAQDTHMLFYKSASLIGILNAQGYVETINPAFEKRLNRPKSEIVGQHLCAFVPPDECSYITYLLDYVRFHEILPCCRHHFVTKNGDKFLTECNAQYLQDSNRIIFVSRDVTHQKAVENRNLDLEQTIMMERMKSDFFAHISHDLKTPLNVIISSVDLVRMKLLRHNPELYHREYERFLKYTSQNCLRLTRLIRNLMDYTNLESGSLDLLLSEGSLTRYLQETVNMLQPFADASGCTLLLESEVSETTLAYLDWYKVDRIVLNLISNSLKYSPSEKGEIRVQLLETPSHFVLQVLDNGCGFPEVMLSQSFQHPGLRNRSTKKATDGAGMGLFIVKNLTTLHNGSFYISNRHSGGASASVTLSKDLHPSEAQDMQSASGYPTDSFIQGGITSLRPSRLQMELSDLEPFFEQ